MEKGIDISLRPNLRRNSLKPASWGLDFDCGFWTEEGRLKGCVRQCLDADIDVPISQI